METTDRYIGQLFDERYEIMEKIGTGGMAVVYKARDQRLNRYVAVKILKEELTDDAELVRRFHTESQAVAMMSHPNIVSVYDVNRFENTEYIVMELIEGITLKQYINRKGILNWKETLHFATQITKALIHAHSRGIVHRDIKPHNIMILRDGSVKVADFGIAQLLTTQNTLTKQALGSVHYISPEQAKGGHVDARSDIYSVGVVMYEMLTSRLPFEGETAVSIAIQHISAIPLMPREIVPEIPAGLESITMHAMEPDLNLRYASAEELLHDLEEFRKNPMITFNYLFRGMPVSTKENGAKKPQQTKPASQQTTQTQLHAPAVPVHSQDTPKKRPQDYEDEYELEEDYDDENADLDRKYARRSRDRRNRKKSNKTAVLVGILGVLLFVVLLLVAMWNLFLKDIFNPKTESVEVPKFIGQAYEYVIDNDEYTKYFNFTPEYEYNDNYNQGIIMRQSINEGRTMTVTEAGIDITVTVSLGEEPGTTMSNLVGMDYRMAKTALEKLNMRLNIEFQKESSDTVTEGYVISTVPAEGEELVEGGTVYITYSSGPEVKMTTVPNVTGVSLSTAISRLEGRDLTYTTTEVEDSAEEGTVVYQNYSAGEEVPVRTEIALQVSTGPSEPEAVTTT
ncbi:MAG: Stk1 family PASTA domain-containing Ser/Thr kinase, partial [Oscillospiraceae bacterium]|nr:Stk1 family PASTA domain-containing Ser/Thr kinase [Oscillospiraceae bacterium]